MTIGCMGSSDDTSPTASEHVSILANVDNTITKWIRIRDSFAANGARRRETEELVTDLECIRKYLARLEPQMQTMTSQRLAWRRFRTQFAKLQLPEDDEIKLMTTRRSVRCNCE